MLNSLNITDINIKTAINREELLNNAMLRDIMVANPHSAKSETLMQELDMRLDPMPEYMKDEIMEGIFVLSAKELLEAKMNMNEHLYYYGFNRLVSASLTDTLIAPVDTLMALLSADGSVASLMKQAWLLLENGDTSAALIRMQSISNEIPLSDSEISELTQQQALMQWLSGNFIIDSLAIETLNNFLQSSSDVVSASARSILLANNMLDYDEPHLVPDFTKSANFRRPWNNYTIPDETFLKVYPNPAYDFITIEFNYDKDVAFGSFIIVDQVGKVIYIKELYHSFDQITLDTHNFKSGNYIIKLISKRKTVCSEIIVISK